MFVYLYIYTSSKNKVHFVTLLKLHRECKKRPKIGTVKWNSGPVLWWHNSTGGSGVMGHRVKMRLSVGTETCNVSFLLQAGGLSTYIQPVIIPNCLFNIHTAPFQHIFSA